MTVPVTLLVCFHVFSDHSDGRNKESSGNVNILKPPNLHVVFDLWKTIPEHSVSCEILTWKGLPRRISWPLSSEWPCWHLWKCPLQICHWLWSRALKGHGTLCCPAAPRMAALVKDNNALTLLDLRLGYTLREPSAIVQRQILLCRGYASTTQYLG